MSVCTISDKVKSDRFVAWLITQQNSHGSLYLERVARQYARYLSTAPPKLDMALSADERNVFACKSTSKFDEMRNAFIAAPNYKAVNENGHQSFSAGLKVYRRYLKCLETENEYSNSEKQIYTTVRQVDFDHPELCTGCDPITCVVEGKDFHSKNWRDLLVTLTEYFLHNKPNASRLLTKSVYPRGERPFLLKEKPQNVTAVRQISNGYWLYLNLGIKDLVFTIGKLCQFCGTKLEDVEITYIPKANKGSGVNMLSENGSSSARFAQHSVREAFRAWLSVQNPEWSESTIGMHYSDAYYLYNNERGVTLETALTTDGGMQKAYDAIEQYFIENQTHTNNPSASARGYIRSLQMLKSFLVECFPEMIYIDPEVAISEITISHSVIEILTRDYATGFRFEPTSLRLLSTAAGVEIDERMQANLKNKMFIRNDGICFLQDIVCDTTTREDIINIADGFLSEYGCFEISELYKLVEEKLNLKCIGDVSDFESFYEQINNSDVRCVAAPQIGNRIARLRTVNVWGTFETISEKIVSIIREEYYGSVNEDELKSRFKAFSTDLLSKMIKSCAPNNLVRVEINQSVCYQTFDALGLPEDFSDVLSEILERFEDIGLEPSQDSLHTAISLKIGVNFFKEFNLPEWETFRRLVSKFYKAEPRREWKQNFFWEVTE